MTIEIIGEKLDLAFKELDISANKTHQTDENWLGTSYQVWELTELQYKELSNDNIIWKTEYGWWRNIGCNSAGEKYDFIINGKSMIGFMEEDNYIHDKEYHGLDDDEEIPQIEFKNLDEYLGEYIGISKPENYAYFIHTLAELNGIKKSDMFKMYW